jgi:hypothetical protein
VDEGVLADTRLRVIGNVGQRAAIVACSVSSAHFGFNS